MNFKTQVLHLLSSGASAYVMALRLRDAQTRPEMLAALQLTEAGSVGFLQKLRDRAAAEGDTWLSAKLERHAEDEQRHGQILAHGLKLIHKTVVDRDTLKQRLDAQPAEQRRSPFFTAYFQGYPPEALSPEQIDWITFIGSTYILELDASKDFVRMAHALPTDPACSKISQGLLSIAKDETSHAAYLLEALHRRLPQSQGQRVVDEWRSRKVNALMAMVGSFLQARDSMPSLVQESEPEPPSGRMEADPAALAPA